MSTPEQARRLIEAIDDQNLERERLFQLIAALGNCLERAVVVETMQHFLGVEPVEEEDRVVFDDTTVSFDRHGRVNGLYRVIDGSTKPPRSGERSGRS